MLLNFNLSDSDLEQFDIVLQKACARAKDLSREQIMANAMERLAKVKGSDVPDFICVSMARIEPLLGMLADETWGLGEDDARRVVTALAYFTDPEDLIPDATPMLGYLDDAIMVELVCRELEHEIRAYRDFVKYRSAGKDRPGEGNAPSQRADWLEERRQQLHARMRRMRKPSGGKKSRSPFSLF